MSGLVNLIPPQNEHVGIADEDGNVKFNMNWYLFIYNISSKVGGTGQPALVYLPGGGVRYSSEWEFSQLHRIYLW